MEKKTPPPLKLDLRVTPDLLTLIDDVRRIEPDLPTRSEVVRRAVEAYCRAQLRKADKAVAA